MRSSSRAAGLLCAISFAGPALAAAPGAAPAAPPPFLTVAMSGNYAPLHEETADGGREGLEPDLAGDLARLLGTQVRFVGRKETGGGSIEAVAAGKADAAIASITPTDERRKLVDFTKPYLVLHYRFAGREGSASAALAPSGKRIAVPRGPAAAVAKALFPGATRVEVPSPDSAAQAVLGGKADLAFGEDVGIVLAIQGRPLKLLGAPLGESPIAIAVPKGQAKRWDDALAKLSGRIAELVKEYRPGEVPDLPGDVYLAFSGGIEDVTVRVHREPLSVSLDQPGGDVEWRSIGADSVRASVPARIVAPPPAVLRRASWKLDGSTQTWVKLADGTFIGFAPVMIRQPCEGECTESGYEVVAVRGEQADSTSFTMAEGT